MPPKKCQSPSKRIKVEHEKEFFEIVKSSGVVKLDSRHEMNKKWKAVAANYASLYLQMDSPLDDDEMQELAITMQYKFHNLK